MKQIQGVPVFWLDVPVLLILILEVPNVKPGAVFVNISSKTFSIDTKQVKGFCFGFHSRFSMHQN